MAQQSLVTKSLSSVWPANLVYAALFNTLHSAQLKGAGTLGGISRERFFAYACAGSFFWYFVPGYIFTALSYFSWVCWIAPHVSTRAATSSWDYTYDLPKLRTSSSTSFSVSFTGWEAHSSLSTGRKSPISARHWPPLGGQKQTLPLDSSSSFVSTPKIMWLI